jgi:hypothetical protein
LSGDEVVRLPPSSALVLFLGSLAPGCRDEPPRAAAPAGDYCRRAGQQKTARFVEKNRQRYVNARDRAVEYLEAFSIDPVALRSQGVKGRKKLVEQLDALASLHRRVKGPLKDRLFDGSEYHDMAAVDDRQFRQDATSYLRACYLMSKMGLDTGPYLGEIRKTKPRLDSHIQQRGAHQRMVFRWYYKHFGLQLPPTLKDPVTDSVISKRPNPYMLGPLKAYQVTHEIFVPFDFGAKLDAPVFDAEERDYLRRTLEVLTTVYLSRRNVDLVGELLAALHYLGNSDLQVYRDGLSFMLTSQRPNGSFGSYEHFRQRRGDILELDLYLHTTSVAMEILPLAFEGP